jgi:hypothetical protein
VSRPPSAGRTTGRTVRRALPAAAAALGAFLVCLAGSVFQRIRLVARVDGISLWSALHRRSHMVLTSWQAAMKPQDWLVFGGVAALAAAAVAARPILGRFARARRDTE